MKSKVNSRRFFLKQAATATAGTMILPTVMRCSSKNESSPNNLVDEQSFTVDFARPIGPVTHRAGGFLHGIKADKPTSELLDPLKIRYVRGTPIVDGSLPGLLDPGLRERLDRPGLRLSLGIYYPTLRQRIGFEDYYPGDGGNWEPWEQEVEREVRAILEAGVDCDYVIWNEPSYETFWPRDRTQFFETWKRGYRKIREIHPDAAITGPTIHNYDFNWLRQFLQYCKQNDVVPDIVTWHELRAGVYADRIPDNVAAVRAWCAENGVAIQDVIIDEYGGRGDQYQPGAAVSFFSALEKAQVRYASRAIWTDTGTLNALTTKDGKQPLSTWWTFKAYSDMSGTHYAVKETKPLRGLASVDKGSAMLLVGNTSSGNQSFRLRLENLSKAGLQGRKFTIQRERIPFSESSPLAAPEKLPELVVEASGDAIVVDAGTLSPHAAVTVTVRAAR